MTDGGPIILSYATPKPSNRFARMPELIVVLLAIIVPGLSSSLIRGSKWRCLCLFPIIPVAFFVFGPLWGEVLFRSTPWKEMGLYPFIVTCVVVEIVSVMLALSDRRKALNDIVR